MRNGTVYNSSSKKIIKEILKDMSSWSNEDLLSNQGYYNLLDRQIAGALLREGEHINTHFQSTHDNTTGSTDGKNITINTFSPIILEIENEVNMLKGSDKPAWASQLPEIRNIKREQYLANIGTSLHECGHVLYTDFNLLNKVREELYEGNFKGCAKEERLEHIYNSPAKGLLQETLMDMVNVVEDGYIENCLCLDYPSTGNVVRGLVSGNRCKFFMSNELDELEAKIDNKEYNFPALFIWMLQIKCVLGYKPKNWENCVGTNHDILVDALEKAQPIVDNYIKSPKYHKSDIFKLCDIVADLFPDNKKLDEMSEMAKQLSDAIKEMMNGQSEDEGNGGSSNQQDSSNQNQSGGSSSENQNDGDDENSSNNNSSNEGTKEDKTPKGNSKEEKKQDALNKQNLDASIMEKALEDAGVSKFAEGRGKAQRSADNSSEAQEKADKAKSEAKQTSDGNQDFSKEAKAIAEEVAKEEMAERQNRELEKSMQESLKPLNRSGYYQTHVYRQRPKTRNKNTYDNIAKNNSKIIKATIRKVSQVLDKRDYDETENGFMIGSQVDINSVGKRTDGAIFKRNIIPDNSPDVVFSIMIDQSGSMCGDKIEKAREMAVIFNEICNGLNVPTRIVGHTTYDGIDVYNYRNFETNVEEGYTLAGIDASGGNIDTVVLAGLAEELLKRQEQSKVLIVISDGLPCGYGGDESDYKGTPLKSDLRSEDYEVALLNAEVRYYNKKGLKVIGVSIDEYEDIKRIYEDGTVDCTNLERLPVEMVKIFKKYVLK